MDERFRKIMHRDYIELFDNEERICSCDNEKEVEEEKEKRINNIPK